METVTNGIVTATLFSIRQDMCVLGSGGNKNKVFMSSGMAYTQILWLMDRI
jgi:hypothetical protein